MPEYESWIEYRDIPGFPGYKVGNDGSVWSDKRGGWRQLRGTMTRDCYLRVLLRPTRSKLVHRLILEAFIGPCPKGLEACHGDGDPTNNKLSNLRWDTPKSNASDRFRHGTVARGFTGGMSKLNQEGMDIIRVLVSKKMSYRAIGRHLGICHHTVSNYIKGITYRKD